MVEYASLAPLNYARAVKSIAWVFRRVSQVLESWSGFAILTGCSGLACLGLLGFCGCCCSVLGLRVENDLLRMLQLLLARSRPAPVAVSNALSGHNHGEVITMQTTVQAVRVALTATDCQSTQRPQHQPSASRGRAPGPGNPTMSCERNCGVPLEKDAMHAFECQVCGWNWDGVCHCPQHWFCSESSAAIYHGG